MSEFNWLDLMRGLTEAHISLDCGFPVKMPQESVDMQMNAELQSGEVSIPVLSSPLNKFGESRSLTHCCADGDCSSKGKQATPLDFPADDRFADNIARFMDAVERCEERSRG